MIKEEAKGGRSVANWRMQVYKGGNSLFKLIEYSVTAWLAGIGKLSALRNMRLMLRSRLLYEKPNRTKID